MKKQRLKRNQGRKGDAELAESGLHVSDCVTASAPLAALIPAAALIKTKANEFITAVSVCQDGTSTDTQHKIALRVQLISMMDALATSVEEIAQGNVEILTSSGFDLTDPSTARPKPVGTVALVGFENVASGKLGLQLQITGYVWAVIVERQNADGTWTKVAVFTDLNDTVVDNLTPGVLNTFRVCAMAAANQTSEWSTPMAGMST